MNLLIFVAKKTFGSWEYIWKVSPIYGQPMVPGGSGNCVLTLEGKKKKKVLMSKLRRRIDRKERKMQKIVVSSMCIGLDFVGCVVVGECEGRRSWRKICCERKKQKMWGIYRCREWNDRKEGEKRKRGKEEREWFWITGKLNFQVN